LTTLAVNALGDEVRSEGFGCAAAQRIVRWLLDQQHRALHPYTQAAPGGWAWTDLSGGVPDADDTAGALLALKVLAPGLETAPAIHPGVRWLLGVQNRDGGIPTFCRGWGALPFDRSSPDLTAHALRAWSAWREQLPPALRQQVDRAMARALSFLARTQRPDGAWSPLWFGNQHAPNEDNLTYGTSRVLRALTEVAQASSGQAKPCSASLEPILTMIRRAAQWLLEAQRDDGGWGGAARVAASTEETALAVEALAAWACSPLALSAESDRVRQSIARGLHWLIERIESGQWTQPAPIGFYFAKLWYFERLYPLVFTVGALNQAR
jgi:squalene-hopene/tetraprenyl-beta-curcumene cyclase